MALLPSQQAKIAGTVLTMANATATTGDTLPTGGALLIQNGGASAITATIAVPGNTKYGQPEPDVTSVSIPAAGFALLGPFDTGLADPSDGLVHVVCSAVTSVKIAAIRV